MKAKSSFFISVSQPDNITLKGRFPLLPEDYAGGLPEQRTHVICLIDFGRAIDLKFHGRNACFLSEGGVKGFECIEMKAGRPWNFQVSPWVLEDDLALHSIIYQQVDLFNLASTIYAIIKGQYMTINFNGERWVPMRFCATANKWVLRLEQKFELRAVSV